MTPIRTSGLRKGPPPPRPAPAANPLTDPRDKNRPLQLMVPPAVFEAFSAEAGRRFGYSKSRLFLAMWAAYDSGT